MFVFLKILLSLFRPIVWVFILFLAAVISKSYKRKVLLLKIGFFVLLFFTNPFIIRVLIQAYQVPPTPLSTVGHYNGGIVLGGFVSYNRSDDCGYFNNASDRFIQTALLYKTGHIRYVIVAAGNGYITKNDFKEADFIKARLVELGVPSGDILTDPYSRNTLENARNSKKIMDSTHLQGPFLLISSALHLPRAQMVFQKQGIQVLPYACDFKTKGAGNNLLDDYLLPSATALGYWEDLIKEWLGVVSYRVTGKG
jgi:uncharacterized SAM-binding protein YcdF (DUF218 family)